MYSVSPEAARLWNALLALIIAKTKLPIAVIDHAPPQPIENLWQRADLAGVFMCGLPFARTQPQPLLIAAPVPSPPQFEGEARYWSDFVVLDDSPYRVVSDTFGRRLALTICDSQSGYGAALDYFKTNHSHAPRSGGPLFSEIIAPTVTPLGALNAVVSGFADIAPIDSYALALLRTYRPELTARVRVVGRTEPTPIPPLVASPAAASSVALAALSSAFLQAHLDSAAEPLMRRLLLRGFTQPAPKIYGVLARRFAAANQYWCERPLAAVTHNA